jgi:hypothetical protein
MISGFSACAGPLLIPASAIAIEARATTIGLRMKRVLLMGSFAEVCEALANGSGINMFVCLRQIIGFLFRAGQRPSRRVSAAIQQDSYR